MISKVIDTFLLFVSAHPHWIGFAVFAATALESMAFIGSLFPGMSMVIALSGVAASLGANVWMLVLWCTLGAIIGDGASYWLGHSFGDRIKAAWPFRTRPELLEKGTEFLQRNGGKSIFIGRFLPFTRAVVPVAAGMLGMNPLRFYVANILSAIGWALMNVLPAAGVGLALSVINQASSRVAVMLGLFVVIYLVVFLTVRLIMRVFPPWLERLLTFVNSVADKHPDGPIRFLTFILGQGKRSSITNIAWVALALGLVLGFAIVLEDVVVGEPLVRADIALNTLMQGFRTPLGDMIMVTITAMGDTTVVLLACAILLGWLLVFRAWRTFGLAFLALAGTSLFVLLLKLVLHRPRPIDIYSDFSFPSGHAAYAAVLWGLIAVIGTRGLSRHIRTVVWTVVLSLSILIGVSRIYLSAHWLSDVMGGLLFGWLMATMFGLFGERIQQPSFRPAALAMATTAALLLGWGVHATVSFDANLMLYTPRVQTISQPIRNWVGGGWKDISTTRIDLKGEREEPLVLQAVAPQSEMEQVLSAAGWSRAPDMGWSEATKFFRGEKKLTALPPLPLLHNGRSALLTMIGPDASGKTRTVIRFWKTGVEVEAATKRRAILVASILDERIIHPFYGVNILRDRATSSRVIEQVIAILSNARSLCLLETTPSTANKTPS